MKIVFWSPVPGQGCTTSSLLAIGTYLATAERKTVSVLPTNCTNHDVQLPFLGYEKEEVFMNAASRCGLDALFRNAKGERLTKSNVEDAALRLTPKLAIFPVATGGKVSSNENTLIETYSEIVNAIDKYNDYVLVDTRGGATKLNQQVIASADILVVCVNQNRSVLETYFNQFDGNRKNIFLLVGDYDRNQSVSIKNIRHRYKSVNSNNSATIWHSSGFSDAMNEGKLLKWMSLNKGCEKKDVNYPFIREVGIASKKILAMSAKIRRDGE